MHLIYNGMRIFENVHLVEKKNFRPKRTHRKKRIAKKWLRRYGYDYDLNYPVVIQNMPTGRVVYMHPVVIAQLRAKQCKEEMDQRWKI